MPCLDLSFLQLLKDDYTKYSTFIETGTYMGDTIFALEQYFNQLYTIEISALYHNTTKSKYTGNKINFLLGDSSVVLEHILPTIQSNTIFFLDGHWSSGDTGKGAKDCPLIEEITNINNVFAHSAIIIIDDCRLFGKGPSNRTCSEDWMDISEDSIRNCIKDRITNLYYLDSIHAKNDRLILHISSR